MHRSTHNHLRYHYPYLRLSGIAGVSDPLSDGTTRTQKHSKPMYKPEPPSHMSHDHSGPHFQLVTTFRAKDCRTDRKATPYGIGIYGMGRHEARVSVGYDHDTPAFVVASPRRRWKEMGKSRYPGPRKLFIIAVAGGTNGYCSPVWKHKLQCFADETRMPVRVSHYPPDASKWNKIEHRLFCHITQNWRGKPLQTFETAVDLIGHTRTDTELRVRAERDTELYPNGVTATRTMNYVRGEVGA